MTADHRDRAPEDHVPEAPAFPEVDPMLVDLIEITNRLAAETVGTLAHHEVAALVRQCRADLSGAPPAALPELIERLARQRLHTPATSPLRAGR